MTTTGPSFLRACCPWKPPSRILQEFMLEAQAGSGSLRVARRAFSLYGFGELTALLAEIKEGFSGAGLLPFALGRVADAGFSRDARENLEALCQQRASSLKKTLWRVADESFTQRGRPPSLEEIEQLDWGSRRSRPPSPHPASGSRRGCSWSRRCCRSS